MAWTTLLAGAICATTLGTRRAALALFGMLLRGEYLFCRGFDCGPLHVTLPANKGDDQQRSDKGDDVVDYFHLRLLFLNKVSSTISIVMSKKLSKKQIKKLSDGQCYFCEEKEYKLLDAHRINEGKDGGTYNWWNILTICCNCHRKIHSGLIKIFGKHPSTGKNLWVIHYEENGEDKWK